MKDFHLPLLSIQTTTAAALQNSRSLFNPGYGDAGGQGQHGHSDVRGGYKTQDVCPNHNAGGISSALAMVMLGARGNTATQMSQVLSFSEAEQPEQPEQPEQTETQQTPIESAVQSPMKSQMQSQMQTRMQMRTKLQQSSRLPLYLQKCLKPQNGEDDVHANFAQLLNEFKKPDAPYALSLANRLYGEQSYQFVEDFLAEIRKHYNAELESVDFIADAEVARVNINSWVEKNTQGKIKDLLGAVDNMTKLVLVNAIYFKGNWNKHFMKNLTVDAQFRINKNDTKPVKMMCQKSQFPLTFIPEANCQVLEMPYKGKELSMLIFLPKEIEDDTTGLEKLEKQLSYEKFVEWTCPDVMGQTEVEVKLPKFKMEEKYDLEDVLTSMGMVDAFDATMSNFSGMSPANDLVLSKVVHKAFVEVNEEGTEAAAATGVIAVNLCYIIPTDFIADHPFLFFIRHNSTMSVLFAGRYCSPE
ncbi:leukocyte elastase inhibitor-like isoform X2 [Thunnus maccoyii]|uniref:leukocyte elastase inhibitor-like isoform X2 n=1 Tax=Thunnus maccoyii TaxID=8240 RepID=UPI001C4AAF8C|nr:leukocyte elastase inhibitor-like isoform X2 [Thunnus maccoyii]